MITPAILSPLFSSGPTSFLCFWSSSSTSNCWVTCEATSGCWKNRWEVWRFYCITKCFSGRYQIIFSSSFWSTWKLNFSSWLLDYNVPFLLFYSIGNEFSCIVVARTQSLRQESSNLEPWVWVSLEAWCWEFFFSFFFILSAILNSCILLLKC